MSILAILYVALLSFFAGWIFVPTILAAKIAAVFAAMYLGFEILTLVVAGAFV